MDGKELELAADARISERVFNLLKTTDLENATFAALQGVGNPIHIENLNRQELFDLVLVNFARLTTKAEWEGLLDAGGEAASFALTEWNWNGDGDRQLLMCLPPWGTLAKERETSGQNNERSLWPFVSPSTGTVSSMTIYINVNSGVTGAVNIGFYSDNDGVPETFLGEAVIDTTSTGIITQTSLSLSPDLVKGTQYWLGQFNDNFDTNPKFGTADRSLFGTGLSTASSALQSMNPGISEAASSGNASISAGDLSDFNQSGSNPISIAVEF